LRNGVRFSSQSLYLGTINAGATISVTKLLFTSFIFVNLLDVVEVELNDGSKIKPVNGYWVKKGAEPIGAEPTPTSSGKAEPKIGTIWMLSLIFPC
jgi:hypothetical protein